MGRYTGPKTKISRRYGVQIFGPSKSLERKNYPPGMHGPKGSRRKQSDYAIALGEKQKLRYQYGLLERQFRRIFQNALRKRGVTGETLLQLLETRLDNVIYRLGLANTGARLADRRSRRAQRKSRAHPVARRNAADRQRAVDRRVVFALSALSFITRFRLAALLFTRGVFRRYISSGAQHANDEGPGRRSWDARN